MKHSLLLLSAISTFMLEAQSYQMVYSNGQSHFSIFPNHHVGLSVSSSSFDGDSVFTLMPQWYTSSGDFQDFCATPDGPSWLGSHIRMLPDGTHYIYIASGDSVMVLTQSLAGESWAAWTHPDGSMWLEISVVSIAEEEVLGQMELVKTFNLQIKNADGQPIVHWINGDHLKVAAYAGLVISKALRNFPEPDYFSQNAIYTLSGKEGIAGVQNITWRDVWDFQTGDELHYEEFYTPGLPYYISKVQTAESYLAREDYPDSTVYTIALKTWSYSGAPQDLYMELVDSSIVQRTIKNKPGFDGLAFTPIVDSVASEEMIFGEAYYIIEYEIAMAKSQAFQLEMANWTPVDCFQPYYSDCTGYNYIYYKGLGGPYYYCAFSNFFIRSREIVYSLKDGVATGVPLSIAYPVAHSTKGILLYPNPAVQNFRILLPEEYFPARATLMDIQGRTIRQLYLPSRETPVEVESLKPGVYIVNITGQNTSARYGRIVVR